MNVYSILETSATRFAHQPAIIDAEGVLTFRELKELSDQAADGFKRSGITPGAGVGLRAKNGREFIVALFALVKCRAVVMPIAVTMTAVEIEDLTSEIPVSFLLADGCVFGKTKPIVVGDLHFYSYQLSAPGASPFVPHIPDAVFIRPTSGTTGRSKGVVLSHQTVWDRINAANKSLEIDSSDKIAWVLAMSQHFIVSVVLYVWRGATIVVSDSDPSSLLRSISENQCTVLYASPTEYGKLAEQTISRAPDKQLNSLRCAYSTSTGLSPMIADRFFDKFALPIQQLYGIIEVGLPIGNTVRSGISTRGSVGKVLAGYTIAIFNHDRTCAEKEVGDLAVKGAGLFDGYVNPEHGAEKAVVDGFFLTGDLAYRDDGEIFVVARKKSAIRINEQIVYPEEIEHVINEFRGIEASRVIGIKTTGGYEILAAEIKVKLGYSILEEELIDYCEDRLSLYKVPQKILLVEAIPLTHSGKIKRYEAEASKLNLELDRQEYNKQQGAEA